MLVDDLQRITDEYVINVNLSLTPKTIWRPFIETVFKGILQLDLDKEDKILVGNLGFLRDAALIFAAGEEQELGRNVSCLSIMPVSNFLLLISDLIDYHR